MYHYVYRITNTLLNKHYYGKRSSKHPPHEDLGIRYFSSSTDKDFKADQKSNSQNYKYKVIKVFSTHVEAFQYEHKLHVLFQVHINPAFYNKAIHTSTSFDLTGYKRTQEAIEKTAKARRGLKHSIEAKEKMRKAKLGCSLSEEHKRKIGIKSTGRLHTEEAKRKIGNSKVKIANIYEYPTNKLIAENVSISEWCRQHPTYSRAHLASTALADRSRPSSRENRCYHKNLYAIYITKEKQ